MRTLKLTIAYDGTAYAGWQCQPDRPTVQETLETAIKKITGESIRTLASGRTDAGVHAIGQVVGFRTQSRLPPEVFVRALNANLPSDIAVLDAAEAPDGFHAIRDVVRKRYRYVIHDGPTRDVFLRHYVWHYPYGRLDADAMWRAAGALVGTHDFTSFESSGAERATSVRTVFDLSVVRADFPSPFGRRAGGEGLSCHPLPSSPSLSLPPEEQTAEMGIANCKLEIANCKLSASNPQSLITNHCAESGDFILIEIEADGFLYNMVRSIVGTLVEVGRGSRPEDWPGQVLRAADRRTAGPTAPPQGLSLVRVEYEPTGGLGDRVDTNDQQ
jgi:tRNA pseudouridine38-40 synthase